MENKGAFVSNVFGFTTVRFYVENSTAEVCTYDSSIACGYTGCQFLSAWKKKPEYGEHVTERQDGPKSIECLDVNKFLQFRAEDTRDFSRRKVDAFCEWLRTNPWEYPSTRVESEIVEDEVEEPEEDEPQEVDEADSISAAKEAEEYLDKFPSECLDIIPIEKEEPIRNDHIIDDIENTEVFERSDPILGTMRMVHYKDLMLAVGMDACDCLDIKDHKQAIKRLDPEGVYKIRLLTAGGPQWVLCLDQGAINELVLSSNKPLAVEAKRWLCREVWVSVQKTGTYIAQNQNIPQLPQNFAEALELAAKIERERLAVCLQNKALEAEGNRLRHLRLLDAPKVEERDHLLETEGMININTLSKILHDKHYINIGPNILFKFLRDHKVTKYTTMWAGPHPLAINIPYQDYVIKGWLDLKHGLETKNIHGFEISIPVIFVSIKGEFGIRDMLLSNGYSLIKSPQKV